MEHHHTPAETSYSLHHGRPWYPREGMKRTHSRSSTSSIRHANYVCPTPRRTRTAASHELPELHREQDSRAHMSKTYAWVAEQEIAEMARQNEETVRWILKQQERDMRDRLMFAVWSMEHKYWHMLDELEDEMSFHGQCHCQRLRGDQCAHHSRVYCTNMEAAIEEEIKRLQARRKETERCRAAYERRKVLEEQRERERRKQRQERGRAEREQAERCAWQEYETKWSALLSDDADGPLSFNMIPWPLVIPPKSTEDIRPPRIAMFLFSSQHSHGQSKKERIRAALRRWHPDRFSRILARVSEEEKTQVEEGAGMVARCLNGLLERTS